MMHGWYSGSSAPTGYPYAGFGTDTSLSAEVDLTAVHLANEVMNFPSLEGADNTQPEWWEVADGNATLTEVDIAGESITETWERGHKVVVASANSYAYQRFTYADQPRLKSGKVVSLIYAVWSVSSATARVRLQSSVGSLGASANTTAAAWTILTVNGVTLDGTYVEIREEVDVGTAYFVPLGFMVGGRAVPLAPRGLAFRWRDPTSVKSLSGITDEDTWTDVDCTSASSNLAAIGVFNIYFVENVSEFVLFVRRNGSSTGKADATRYAVANASGVWMANQVTVVLDDGQVFEYLLDRTGGTSGLDVGSINLQAWWEWE